MKKGKCSNILLWFEALKYLEVGAVSWTISLLWSLFVWVCTYVRFSWRGGRWKDTDTERAIRIRIRVMTFINREEMRAEAKSTGAVVPWDPSLTGQAHRM